jgi:type IV pilus assembly protein PilB
MRPATADLSVNVDGTRFGELLLREHVLRAEQVVEALLQQGSTGKRVGTLLVELGLLEDADLARLLAQHLGLAFVDLRQTTPQAEALAMLPEATARAIGAIPLELRGDKLVVAVMDPAPAVHDQLAAAVEHGVEVVVASASQLRRAIDKSYRALTSVDAQVQAFEARDALRRAAARAETATANDDAPVVQVVNLVIAQALRDRASDIHIEPHEGSLRVRYRIDGALHDVLALPAAMGPAIVSRIKIMSGMNIVERRRPQDGQITTEVEGRSVDIRVATAATIWGEKVVMRLLDKSRPLYHLGDLGMPADTADRYLKLLRSPYGMVICAGPTGSGKTTTLYGSLSELNSPDRNIMTIEDPVEYVFPSINQIQINEQAGITFAGGLKSILRQDPDVILVGEIREVGIDRPFRALLATRDRCGVGLAPPTRHGDRDISGRVVGNRRGCPATRAPDLQLLPNAV